MVQTTHTILKYENLDLYATDSIWMWSGASGNGNSEVTFIVAQNSSLKGYHSTYIILNDRWSNQTSKLYFGKIESRR